MIISYPRFLLRLMLALGVVWGTVYLAMRGQSTFAALCLTLGILAVYLFKDARQIVRHTAHFSSKFELHSLTRSPLKGDGVLLGFAYRSLLSLRPGTAGKQELGHFLWVGPSRSGKGLSIASNLLHWEGSAVVVDIKGELAAQTAGYRREVLGQRVFILNPSSGEASHQYDPFAALVTNEQIYAAAIAYMQPDKDGANAVFALRASAALAAIIRAAKVQEVPVIELLRDVLYHPLGVQGAMLSLQRLSDPQVSRWINAFLSKDPDKVDWREAAADRFLNNSWQRLLIATQNLMTQGVAHLLGGSDFTPADLVEGRTTVYLVFRESELAMNLPILNLVIDSLFRSIMRRYDLNPDLPGEKLLAVFDEAYRATPLMLPEYAATLAGRGISMCIYVQSLAQLSDLWGKEGRTAIMENVHTKIFLPAVDRSDSDREGTSKFISDSCGKYMVEDRGLGKSEHEHELSSTVRFTERELVTTTDFAMLSQGRSIIICNNLPPVLAYRLEPWRFREHRQAAQYSIPKVVCPVLSS
ncbi:type IV secretory system conjugative DNA transfer family protein [Deinococcus sp.]|uniref:type IV secretory system conjugative DNA transfer family protein n=1 Tax=Deinococcus sp. TaxID=47478 RepID=UPI0025EEB89E|nr:type IV secretory system conjugative DNA transfer family protein [Deinococcus sp.]